MINTDSFINNTNTKALRFLNNAKTILPLRDLSLLSEILREWHSALSLKDLTSSWQNCYKLPTHQSYAYLNLLSFNVRGLDQRWGEVCLLVEKQGFEIIVLGEVGRVDFELVGAAFSNYRYFHQKGENAHGGVLILVRNSLSATRVPCDIPNVCVLDLIQGQRIRVMGIYAPASKTWQWSDLGPFVETHCVIMGDFNIDIERDGDKAEQLLEWMDSCSLGPVIPDTNTSLRSERTIDYALVRGLDILLQAHENETTSDHKPLFGVLSQDARSTGEGVRTSWSVFSLALQYTSDFWEVEWNKGTYDDTYDQFIIFLTTLIDRCKQCFPLKRTRPTLPKELVNLLAQSRALSYKAKRKGDILLRQEAHGLRNRARFELKIFQQSQLTKQLKLRNAPAEGGAEFWRKTKGHFRAGTSSLRGFLLPNGETTQDPQKMANSAAEHYEKLFEAPIVVRPHPYVDAPTVYWDNWLEPIPGVTYLEVLGVLRKGKKKRSLDTHGLSPYILDKIPKNYWHFLIKLFNYSFASSFIPKKFKEARIVLLAKKNAICTPDQTRPISLLDSFLKVQEKLFQNRFVQILAERGILPDNQSGFRAKHRLQTRVLLLIEQISSYMSNSAPVATVFVDFKSAFDQLWFDGCLGKLIRLGIPQAFVNWIKEWLHDRKAVIEIQGKRSKWFDIRRGGPQGSSFTPTLFITYHSDMENFIPQAMSFFFADDLAAVLAGQMGIRYTDQCIDLERRLHSFLGQLEAYSILAGQPLNYPKTQAMFSARAILYPNPLPDLKCGDQTIEWVPAFKYLGYSLTTKLGWGNIIGKSRLRTRQLTAMTNSFRFSGNSSLQMRRVLFSTFVMPYFTWLFGIYPLFTEIQRIELNHLYFTLLKRVYRCQYWEDFIFSSIYDEKPLDDLCYAYWTKYTKALAKTKDGFLLIEQSSLNANRSKWQEGAGPVRCLHRSKRFVPHVDVLGQALRWMSQHGSSDSVVALDQEELVCFAMFPESFR